ncbi:hypothetical protein TeGR_g12643 [Tetraparma gracilis]|uniref:Uncharacterized protein n=1 Tax=Tetraparma gracilis TaxID=2962635 RepID=A0ABQ6M4D2_9STRA|nr:hypothetical protein TeGR_g12643 [Tetraparma gracilis]
MLFALGFLVHPPVAADFVDAIGESSGSAPDSPSQVRAHKLVEMSVCDNSFRALDPRSLALAAMLHEAGGAEESRQLHSMAAKLVPPPPPAVSPLPSASPPPCAAPSVSEIAQRFTAMLEKDANLLLVRDARMSDMRRNPAGLLGALANVGFESPVAVADFEAAATPHSGRRGSGKAGSARKAKSRRGEGRAGGNGKAK